LPNPLAHPLGYNAGVLIRFSKMHGLGNDFVVINGCPDADEYQAGAKDSLDKLEQTVTKLASGICNRHYGIGADGVIVVFPSTIADFRMHYVNSDGSLSAMCGNGVRCIGKFVYDNGLTTKSNVALETGAGIINLALAIIDGYVAGVTVDMGVPNFEASSLPAMHHDSKIVEEKIDLRKDSLIVTCLSLGNPHCVHFIESEISVCDYPVSRLGPKIEHLTSVFPKRVNVEFAKVLSRDRIELRVWERGCGETLACGSGACATVAAGIVTGRIDNFNPVAVLLPGGTLEVSWSGKAGDGIRMFGPAETVFTGEFDTDSIE
jgi:diaminopimelate epimerase